jgi:hypothetical protein
MSNEASSQLTTALQAAQSRTRQRISIQPAALSEGLVRQAEFPEIDFAAETAQALDTLETAVVEYQGKEGKPNTPLIEARNAVVLLEAQLERPPKNTRTRRPFGAFRNNQGTYK